MQLTHRTNLCIYLIAMTIYSVQGSQDEDAEASRSGRDTQFKILLYPAGVKSHVNEQVAVGEELLRQGHVVYMALSSVTPQSMMDKYTKMGIKVTTFQSLPGRLSPMSTEFEGAFGREIFAGRWSVFSEVAKMMFDAIHGECDDAMTDKSFLGSVRDLNLDLVLVDGILVEPCRYLLPYYIKVPYFTMTGVPMPWFARVPTMPSVTPSIFFDANHEMSFIQRLLNLLGNMVIASELVRGFGYTELLKEYAPEVRSWSELIMRSEFFINTMDHHLEWPAPTMPNVRYIPGITIGPSTKGLEPDIKAKADAAKKGIIVFSFGSLGGFMPANLTARILAAFANLEQTVFMRLASAPEGLTIPSNVHLMKWLPQNELLAHPNTIVFITHCGNNGQYEALYHGVPMLGIPLAAEQSHNAFRIHSHGFGLRLNLMTFTSQEMREALQELVSNTTYHNNIRTRAAALRDRPMLPKEEVVYWVEHVIKHGGDYMRSSGVNLSLFQFFMLDALLVLAVIVIILLWLICMIVSRVIRTLKRVFKSEKKKVL